MLSRHYAHTMMGALDVAFEIRRPQLPTAHAEVYLGLWVLKNVDSGMHSCQKWPDGRLQVHSRLTRISGRRIRVPRTVGTVPRTPTIGLQTTF